MSDKHERNEGFRAARDAFDGLEMDEQAVFLVEAAMSMVARGARGAGEMVSKVLDDLAKEMDDACEPDAGETEPAAEATSKTPPKKTPPKKAAPKKAAPRKRAPRKKKTDDDTDA